MLSVLWIVITDPIEVFHYFISPEDVGSKNNKFVVSPFGYFVFENIPPCSYLRQLNDLKTELQTT